MDTLEVAESEFYETNSIEKNKPCDIILQVANNIRPQLGQEFSSLDDVLEFYNAYAKEAGFSVQKWSEKKNASKEIIRKKY